jgi:hypothetical protein
VPSLRRDSLHHVRLPPASVGALHARDEPAQPSDALYKR